MLWLTYTYLASLLSMELPEPWRSEVPLLVFFLLPPISYGYIIAYEKMSLVGRSLLPLLMMAMRPADAVLLTAMRERLISSMQGLVDESGWREPPTPPRVLSTEALSSVASGGMGMARVGLSSNSLEELEALHAAAESGAASPRAQPAAGFGGDNGGSRKRAFSGSSH